MPARWSRTGTAAAIFAAPRASLHAAACCACIPVPGRTRRGEHLGTIPGIVPSLIGEMRGCHFADRCPHAIDACRQSAVPLETRPVGRGSCAAFAMRRSPRRLASSDRGRVMSLAATVAAQRRPGAAAGSARVSRTFQVSAGMLRAKRTLRAVDGVDLAVARGEVLALVGESGCGKTTLARMLLGLLPPTAGEIRIDGRPSRALGRREIARRDPAGVPGPLFLAQPAQAVGSIIALPLRRAAASARPTTWRAKVERHDGARGAGPPRSTTTTRASSPAASASASPSRARWSIGPRS